MPKNTWTVIILAVVIYAVLLLLSDLSTLGDKLQNFDWRMLLVLIVLISSSYLVRLAKWHSMMRRSGCALSKREDAFVFFSGLSMTITPAKAGEVWKAWLVKDMKGTRVGDVLPVVIVDRMTDIVALALLSLTGLLIFSQDIWIALFFVLLVAAATLLVRNERVVLLIARFFTKRNESLKEELLQTTRGLRVLFRFQNFLPAFGLALVAWSLECVGLYVVALGFGGGVDLLACLYIYSFASLAGAISMIPGGLGVAEVTMGSLLVTFGMGAGAAIATTTLFRLGSLWYGTALGFLTYRAFKKSFIPTQKEAKAAREIDASEIK